MKAVRDDLHVLTGSYVLDAISETEREEFERHLQYCPTCDAEVRGLRETAARLALACAVNPPARMERQVLAATYRTRQLPPLSAGRPGRSEGPGSSTSRAAWPSSPPRPAWPRPSPSGSPSCPPSTSSTRRVTPRSPGWSPRRRPCRDRADQRRRERHRGHLRRAARSRGQHQRDGFAAVQPRLPGVGDEPVRRAFGRTDARQSLLASAVRPGDRIGITVEPAGGTTQPTTTPLAVLPVWSRQPANPLPARRVRRPPSSAQRGAHPVRLVRRRERPATLQ